MQPEQKNYPDAIILTPSNTPILQAVFSYKARVYDLNDYESVMPGGGQRVWDMYVREEAHQKAMREAQQRRPSFFDFFKR